jgi:hypothetical protein
VRGPYKVMQLLLVLLLISVQLIVVRWRRVTTRSLDLRPNKRFRVLVDAEIRFPREIFGKLHGEHSSRRARGSGIIVV